MPVQTCKQTDSHWAAQGDTCIIQHQPRLISEKNNYICIYTAHFQTYWQGICTVDTAEAYNITSAHKEKMQNK